MGSSLATQNDLPTNSSRNPSSLPCKKLFSPPVLQAVKLENGLFYVSSLISAHPKTEGSAEPQDRGREYKYQGTRPQ